MNPRSPQKPKKTYGVIGDPVAHSLSPAMHNAAFKEMGLNAVYKHFPVKAHELPAFFKRLRAGEIDGVNVTLPHKERVQPFLDHITPLAAEIGAINLITRKGNALYGDNTDAPGYLASLVHETRFDSRHENVIVIGAGGAGRAICHILCDNGIATLTVINRSVERAHDLIENLKKYHKKTDFRVFSFNNIDPDLLSRCHLMVNASSLGMSDNNWPTLDFLAQLNKAAIVSDIVYTPRETQFLKEAKRHGLTVHYGDSMLLYQGVISFERLTGRKAPVKVMKQVLSERLLVSGEL